MFSLENKVKELAQQATRPIIDTTVREIAEKIKRETGVEYSTATIWAALKKAGAVAHGKRWSWRHNPPKGE